jgi:hypothetical protein
MERDATKKIDLKGMTLEDIARLDLKGDKCERAQLGPFLRIKSRLKAGGCDCEGDQV